MKAREYYYLKRAKQKMPNTPDADNTKTPGEVQDALQAFERRQQQYNLAKEYFTLAAAIFNKDDAAIAESELRIDKMKAANSRGGAPDSDPDL